MSIAFISQRQSVSHHDDRTQQQNTTTRQQNNVTIYKIFKMPQIKVADAGYQKQTTEQLRQKKQQDTLTEQTADPDSRTHQ